MVRESWQRILERDGSFVVRADEQTCFVVRRATSEDQLVGYISALTARGDMHWEEEIRKRPGQLDEHVYTAAFPDTSLWKATLQDDSEHVGVYYLLVSRLEEGTILIRQPHEVISKLYHRVYKQYGHPVLHLSAFDDPDFRKSWEKEQRLLEAGLSSLERAFEKYV